MKSAPSIPSRTEFSPGQRAILATLPQAGISTRVRLTGSGLPQLTVQPA